MTTTTTLRFTRETHLDIRVEVEVDGVAVDVGVGENAVDALDLAFDNLEERDPLFHFAMIELAELMATPLDDPIPCVDCLVEVQEIGEWYMVNNDVWIEAGDAEVLCIGCLERRLGRRLFAEDFANVPLNVLDGPWRVRSGRILDRFTTCRDGSIAPMGLARDLPEVCPRQAVPEPVPGSPEP